MIEKYSKLKTATGGIIRWRNEIDERFKRITDELEQTEAKLDMSVRTDQDDLAMVLLEKKNELVKEHAELTAEGESTWRCRFCQGFSDECSAGNKETSSRARYDAGKISVGAGESQNLGAGRRTFG